MAHHIFCFPHDPGFRVYFYDDDQILRVHEGKSKVSVSSLDKTYIDRGPQTGCAFYTFHCTDGSEFETEWLDKDQAEAFDKWLTNVKFAPTPDSDDDLFLPDPTPIQPRPKTTCPECYGTKFFKGFGGPCTKC